MQPDDTTLELRIQLAALKNERRTLLDILDLVPFFVYAIDETGSYRLANKRVAEDLGHTTESILQVRFQDVSPDREQAQVLVDRVRDKLNAGVPVVTRDVPLRVNATGDAIIDLFEAPFRDAEGKEWLLGIARDKTDELELERARVERARLDRDLTIARTIQQSLLPNVPPDRADLDVAGWSRPADDTGGDFYDWFETAHGSTCIVLGDVTGHGIGPALIAATARAYARAVFDAPGSLEERAARFNNLLVDELPVNFFVTLAVAEIPHDAPASARYISAGHGPTYFVPPAQFGDRGVRLLQSHGPPMGVVPGLAFDEATPIPMIRGALLVLASDGFNETANPEGALLGSEPLERIVSDRLGTSSDVVDRFQRLADSHAQGQPQADDMTAVAITAR